MTDVEKRQIWSRKVLNLYKKGHYRKAWKLMADNVEDQGKVESMIWALCQNMDPAPYVFGKKGGQNHESKHGS